MNLSKVRGRDALYIEDHDSHLEIVAELVRGAQIGRGDRIVFSRKSVLHKSPMVHYRATLLVTGSNAHKFCDAIIHSKVKDSLKRDGIDTATGVLRLRIPVDETSLERWRKAKTGTTYTVHSFMIESAYLVDLCVSRWNAEGAKTIPTWAVG